MPKIEVSLQDASGHRPVPTGTYLGHVARCLGLGGMLLLKTFVLSRIAANTEQRSNFKQLGHEVSVFHIQLISCSGFSGNLFFRMSPAVCRIWWVMDILHNVMASNMMERCSLFDVTCNVTMHLNYQLNRLIMSSSLFSNRAPTFLTYPRYQGVPKGTQ